MKGWEMICVLNFYCRYVDDTLLLIKKDKIQHVLNSFNSFNKNLRFSVDTFDDGNIHFLDSKIWNNGETYLYKRHQYWTLCSISLLWTLEHENCLGMLIVSESAENLQQPTFTYDASKLLENSYVMEWIPSLHQD